jgi:hypothetical protein
MSEPPRYRLAVVNACMLVVAVVSGHLGGVLWLQPGLDRWLPLGWWSQCIAVVVATGTTLFLWNAVAARWTKDWQAAVVPAALVTILPVLLDVSDCLVRDNRRLGLVDLARDLAFGASRWQSWVGWMVLLGFTFSGWAAGRSASPEGAWRSRTKS